MDLTAVVASVRRVAVAIVLAMLPAAAAADDGLLLRSPSGGAVRAIIIGVDAYRHIPALKGAVADARDLETTLRRMGASDVTALLDGRADRVSILGEISRLVARTQQNDLVFLSIAGHGAQEPERVRGSEPDGMENVFLLPDFQPTAAGSQQRILGKEFNHFIKQFELRGARVIFIADACHGGGLAREIDPRAHEMSFRQAPSYRLSADTLRPVTTASEAFTTELDFDHTEFLAAVDRKTKAPEVAIPGIEGLRGALSYAMARALEGSADSDKDGRITVKELFTNVRQAVYQLSNQRQNIVAVTSPGRNIDTDVVFQVTRGVSVIEQSAAVKQPTRPAASSQAGITVVAAPPATASKQQDRPIRVAALDGQGSHFSGVSQREAAFEVVRPSDNADIVWDPVSRDVISGGDVIAYRLDKSELPSAIDRAAAVRELKRIATQATQPVRIGPDDRLHRNESVVQVELSDVKDRALILFNIAGDGTVQMLYPVGSDNPIITAPVYQFPVRVREPFGADQIVAITSGKRMPELEKVLSQLDRRRAAAQVIRMVQRYAPPDSRIGSTGLFTAP